MWNSSITPIANLIYIAMVVEAKRLKDSALEDESAYDKLQKIVTDINEALKQFKIKSKNV